MTLSDAPDLDAAATDDLSPVSEAAVGELCELIREAFRNREPALLEEAALRAAELSELSGWYGLQQQSVLAHIVAHELRTVCNNRAVRTDNWQRIDESCTRLQAVARGEPMPGSRPSQSGVRRRVSTAPPPADPEIDTMLERVFDAE